MVTTLICTYELRQISIACLVYRLHRAIIYMIIPFCFCFCLFVFFCQHTIPKQTSLRRNAIIHFKYALQRHNQFNATGWLKGRGSIIHNLHWTESLSGTFFQFIKWRYISQDNYAYRFSVTQVFLKSHYR